jgi:hypothetical protein
VNFRLAAPEAGPSPAAPAGRAHVAARRKALHLRLLADLRDEVD